MTSCPSKGQSFLAYNVIRDCQQKSGGQSFFHFQKRQSTRSIYHASEELLGSLSKYHHGCTALSLRKIFDLSFSFASRPIKTKTNEGCHHFHYKYFDAKHFARQIAPRKVCCILSKNSLKCLKPPKQNEVPSLHIT